MNSRQSVMNNASASVGVVPRAVQLDFEKEEKKIQQFESTNKKFYKDVKCYVEKIDELNKSESKMINNLSNLVNNSSTTSGNSTQTLNTTQTSSLNSSTSTSSKNSQFNTQQQLADMTTLNIANTDLNDQEFLVKLKQWKELLNEHNKSCEFLKQTCQKEVIEPMKNLNSLFPQVYAAIKKREHTYKELLKQQEKLDKAQEKERTGANLVKITEISQAVNVAKQQFQKEHLFLMEELPKLFNLRIDYIRPCINSLIQSQSDFYEKYSNLYETILNSTHETTSVENKTSSAKINGPPLTSSMSFSSSSSSASSSSSFLSAKNNVDIEKIDQDIQKCLNDIKSLSIVAGD
jgi:hypothetical protein